FVVDVSETKLEDGCRNDNGIPFCENSERVWNVDRAPRRGNPYVPSGGESLRNARMVRRTVSAHWALRVPWRCRRLRGCFPSWRLIAYERQRIVRFSFSYHRQDQDNLREGKETKRMAPLLYSGFRMQGVGRRTGGAGRAFRSWARKRGR